MGNIKVTQLKPDFEKLLPENSKYDPLYAEIYSKFSALTSETASRVSRNLDDKNFYLGEYSEHWDDSPNVGDVRPIVNYSAAIVNKYADLLTAGEVPGIQVISPSEDEQVKAYASAAENILYRVLDHNQFARLMHYGAVNGSMLGDTFFHIYWDAEKTVGGAKGSVVINNVSPFFIRVGFARDNWDDIDYWISESRVSPSFVKNKWGIEVPATYSMATTASGGSSINAPFDSSPVESSKTYIPMVTLCEYHDAEKDAILVGDQAVLVKQNSGNHGLYHIRNRTAPNEPWGYPDHYNIKEQVKSLNKLHGQAQEIVKYHAAPAIIDKGNVLGGKRLKSRSNVVITTTPYGPGEGLEYLQWSGNIFPVDQLIKEVTTNIHDLAEMPAAAFGSYQPGTASGFALSIQMQPTLMRVKIKQNAEWGPNLTEMFHYILKLIIENDKSVKLPKEVADFDIRIRFPNPLPREDAREIQNAVALVTNKLTSKETARQSLLVEDVVEEEKRIEREAIKEAEVAAEQQKIAMEAQMQAQAQVQGQGETALNSPIQPGQAAEQAFPAFQEEQRPTAQKLGLEGGESIAPTSTEVPT